jgi:hypothetical protein
MDPLADIASTARRARTALLGALDRAEREPLLTAIEAHARAQALLLARLLLTEIAQQLAEPPASPEALASTLEAALAAALRAYLNENAR